MLISRIISRNSPVLAQIRYRRSRLSTETIIIHKDVVDKHKKVKFVEELNEERSRLAAGEDMPVQGMSNPYQKPAEKCLICKHNIPLDWKNTRFLSQFTSPYTGRIYDRGVTGLCLFMQRRISKLIIRSQFFGYMPYEIKDPKFVKDPKLFDPFRRK